jgi:hypothetical protein
MTDRDTFAAAALTGLLADDGDRVDHAMPDFTARAYEWADAMLREQSKSVTPDPAADGTGWPTSGAGVTLTDEEREAIEVAADSTTVCIPPIKDTLRSLLERLRT